MSGTDNTAGDALKEKGETTEEQAIATPEIKD